MADESTQRQAAPEAEQPGDGQRQAAPDEPVKVDEQLLAEVIDAIRPSFQADGGDLELVGVDENGVVTIEMVGACAGCFFAASDITEGIDRIIKDHVPGVTAVRPLTY